MEVVYNNSFGDSLKFNIYHQSRNPFTIVFSTIIALLFLPWQSFKPLNALNLMIIVLWVVVFYLLYVLINIFFLLIILPFSKNKSFLTTHKINLNDESLIEETKWGTTIYKWNGIHKLKKTKRYLYIYLSPTSAHIIPKKSFSTIDEYNIFVDYIQNKIGVKD